MQLTRQSKPRNDFSASLPAVAKLLAHAEHAKVSPIRVISRNGTVVVTPNGQSHGHCGEYEADDAQASHAHGIQCWFP